ncbi:hypothetical protein N0V88_001593 [Collariella sp. IMI 366227]|nr:hypothetical protein N0V88_001593 [Collariella sp. IMI 366227]
MVRMNDLSSSSATAWALIKARDRTEPRFRNILDSTRGIAFMGTPHRGSGLAEWGKQLARTIGVVKQVNHEIIGVLKTESEVLAEIQDRFHTMVMARSKEQIPIEISCFYEELPVIGIGAIVPQHSAILPGFNVAIGIHANHMNMCKFSVPQDPGFLAVCGELREWIGKIKEKASQSWSLGPLAVGGRSSENEPTVPRRY